MTEAPARSDDRPTREQTDAVPVRYSRALVDEALVHADDLADWSAKVDRQVLAAEVRALRAEQERPNEFSVRAALAARTPQPAEPHDASTAELLRAAAAGRREYAGPEREGGSGNAKVDEMRDVLLTQAATLDGAAKVADGDYGPLYGWLPSWRWTPAMAERTRAWSTGQTSASDVADVAAPVATVPDGARGHRPETVTALQGLCAQEQCGHSGASDDECPWVEVQACTACSFRGVDLGNADAVSLTLWPCSTVAGRLGSGE